MREKLVAPTEDSIPQLASRCAGVSNRSARVALNLEKLASGRPEAAVPARSLASTVGDFVQEMDMMATLLEGMDALSDRSRRHLEVLVSDAEELASSTASVLGRDGNGPASASLEKLAQTEQTWRMMLHLVTSFQSVIQLQDEQDAADVLEMTTGDFDELERLISRVQVTETPQPLQQGITSPVASPVENNGLPDYDTAVSSPTSQMAFPGDHKQPMHNPEEQDLASSSATRPKLGTVGGFFRSITNKLVSPVPPLVSPLCQAAAAGNIEQVRGLLAQGASINAHNEEGYTCVTSAIHGQGHKDQLAMVRFLLDSGAKVSAKDAIWSLPPLWHACRVGRLDIVDLLVTRGADVRGRNTSGQPHFYHCIEKDPAPVVEHLLRHGADPNAQSISGNKGIASCVKRGDLAKVRILLAHGAKATATTPTGHPLLAVAAQEKNAAMAALLLDHGADASANDAFGNAILSVALDNADEATARLLVDRGAHHGAKDMYGNPALVTAVTKDLPAMTALLLSRGAHPDAKDCRGRPVLALAVSGNKPSHARHLLQRGAEVKIAANQSGFQHLITAVVRQKDGTDEERAAFVRLLLDHGSDPDLQPASWDSVTGHTPLGHCVREGRTGLLRLLLERGAGPHRSGQRGTVVSWDPMSAETPFRYAIANGRAESVRVMLECGAIRGLRGGKVDVDGVVLEAAGATRDGEIIRMLLDEGLEDPEGALARVERLKNEELNKALRARGPAGLRIREQQLPEGLRLEPGEGVEAPPPYEGAVSVV